jgi:hypothetical protein
MNARHHRIKKGSKRKNWHGDLALSMPPCSDGQTWTLTETLSYLSDPDGPGEGQIFTVGAGLRVDGASIPRFFWRVIGCPLRGRYAPGAAIHDGFYKSHVVTRRKADQLFLEMLRDLGVGEPKALAMYSAVRIGGGRAWDKTPQDEKDRVSNLVLIT